MVGLQVSGFTVREKLGEGGMGEVWLADGARGPVAIKLLHPVLADSAELAARFRREMEATRRLRHPNIVAVEEAGALPDGRLYLVMEYAEGRSLEQVLVDESLLPLGPALRVLVQLADAIDHAHAMGVVHRDLKPQNLILVGDLLKVLDFGIAKIIAEDHDSFGLTRAGDVFGSPEYMSPEQWAGGGRDPRIDIYAFGCIAHELTTGRTPFQGRTMALMQAHTTQPPPRPSASKPGLPDALDALVLRCLAKDPEARFATGRELRTALEAIPVDESENDPTEPGGATSRWLQHAATIKPSR